MHIKSTVDHFLGTRIIYERKFLLDMRNSPLSKTPTKQLPVIPGITLDDNGALIEEDEEQIENEKNKLKEKVVELEEQNGNDLKKNIGTFVLLFLADVMIPSCWMHVGRATP